jgi:hypothetical protein
VIVQAAYAVNGCLLQLQQSVSTESKVFEQSSSCALSSAARTSHAMKRDVAVLSYTLHAAHTMHHPPLAGSNLQELAGTEAGELQQPVSLT